MNDIYIDANVSNSFAVSSDNSEFTYKLAEPLELPKGTQIAIQQSFINKKGITGGSIEIDEDIDELIEYIYYITEQAHFQPLAGDGSGTIDKRGNWCRSTLKIAPQSFACNFDLNAFNTNPLKNTWTADTGKVLYGELLADEDGGDGAHANGNDYWLDGSEGRGGLEFTDYGGNNMILPQVKWIVGADGDYYMNPVIKSLNIFIPRGVYGIGQLGQLIEDYFNGAVSVLVDGNGRKTIDRRTDMEKKMEDIFDTSLVNDNDVTKNKFDGGVFNSPTIDRVFIRNDRRFRTDGTNTFNLPQAVYAGKPVYEFSNIGMDGFTAMDCYNELLDYTQMNGLPYTHMDPNNNFKWSKIKDTDDMTASKFISTAQNDRRPFYYFTCPEDEGSLGNKPIPKPNPAKVGNGADSVLSLYGYNIHGYSDHNKALDGSGSRILSNQSLFTQMIGTTNFSFEYNTEKNGFEIKGLHQVCIAPSHSKAGIKNSSAGNNVINVKKVVGRSFRPFPVGSQISKFYQGDGTGAGGGDNAGFFNNHKNIQLIRNQLNTPETRLGGIMILNWAVNTSKNNRTSSAPTTTAMDLGKNFADYFNDENEARQNWTKTIWYKLGFDFDQIQNRDKFKKQTIYNKDYANNIYYSPKGNRDCGYTTDTLLDNTIIPTISTLNNPMFIPKSTILPAKSNAESVDFQIYGYGSVSRPWDVPTIKNAISNNNQFSNSLYNACSVISVSIADVGGITANRLPTLTSQSYYLITCDLLDNFKDNVKKGEPLALLGVVAKTNLSNQDFIVDKNDITQTLSQSKVINKIKFKILNPNLTHPILENSSSILLKLTKPNITPTSLLPPKEIKTIAQEVQTF